MNNLYLHYDYLVSKSLHAREIGYSSSESRLRFNFITRKGLEDTPNQCVFARRCYCYPGTRYFLKGKIAFANIFIANIEKVYYRREH